MKCMDGWVDGSIGCCVDYDSQIVHSIVFRVAKVLGARDKVLDCWYGG